LSKDAVLQALADAGNAHIQWAIGSVLRERLDKEDWQECVLLQQLASANLALQSWNELFLRTRASLENEDELRTKASSLLKPAAKAFDSCLEDLIGEMLAVLYLAEAGHEAIHFVPECDAVTADIESIHCGARYFTEAKNLREPRSLTFVAFRRWIYNLSAQPERFKFRAEFIDLEDPFEDLTSAQEKDVIALVDDLPNKACPSVFYLSLTGGRRVRVRLSSGTSVMLRHGPGPFLVDQHTQEAQRSLVVKLIDPARKALTQLYATNVPDDSYRLLFVRWKVPDDLLAIGEAENVRNVVQKQTESYFRAFFPRFSLAILHTGEDVRDTPKAVWE
jgi:hypothetical protein